MKAQPPKYQTAADVLDRWRDDVLQGTPPTFFPVGKGELARIEVGPGLVNLVGGAPGAGKTALTMQFTVDALRLTPTLRALVCNVEMPPATLLDRQLARLSGVDLTTIRYRRLGSEHAKRIDAGIATLESIGERLCFLRSPFDLGNVAAAGDDFDAGLILLDYIQRIAPPGEHENRRSSVDATMSFLRQFADAGVAVVVVSAVGRSKDSKGRNSYDAGLNLASFRESSELEFGADSAWILTPDRNDDDNVILRHLKDRHGECRDLPLTFDGARQSFAPVTERRSDADQAATLADLRGAWNRAEPASEGDTDA